MKQQATQPASAPPNSYLLDATALENIRSGSAFRRWVEHAAELQVVDLQAASEAQRLAFGLDRC
eukprot:16420-Eustigmatos_ZCMA.PRE.1